MSINQGINKTKRTGYFPDPRVHVLAGKFIVMGSPARISRLGRFSYFGYISDQQPLLGTLSAPVAAFSFMTVLYARSKMACIRTPWPLYFSCSIFQRKWFLCGAYLSKMLTRESLTSAHELPRMMFASRAKNPTG